MKIRWQVEDGYIGHGPQETEIPDDELDECETDEEKEKLIGDYIQSDFEQKISWRTI